MKGLASAQHTSSPAPWPCWASRLVSVRRTVGIAPPRAANSSSTPGRSAPRDVLSELPDQPERLREAGPTLQDCSYAGACAAIGNTSQHFDHPVVLLDVRHGNPGRHRDTGRGDGEHVGGVAPVTSHRIRGRSGCALSSAQRERACRWGASSATQRRSAGPAARDQIRLSGRSARVSSSKRS